MAKKQATRTVVTSRMKRYEEKRLRTRLIFILLAFVGLILVLGIFGVKMLFGFFVVLENLGNSEDTNKKTELSLVLPPTLDPLPNATSSGKIIITGRGQKEDNILLYINDEESKKIRVSEDGTFIISSITLPEGDFTIKAKAEDTRGKLSEFSHSIKIQIKRRPPVLEVTKPEDGATHSGEDNLFSVEGKTEEDTDVRVNDRFVVVRADGSFSYPFPLADGENTLKIKATDRAGNSTEVTRKITYKK